MTSHTLGLLETLLALLKFVVCIGKGSENFVSLSAEMIYRTDTIPYAVPNTKASQQFE